jgi:hypothetical protein
LQSSRLSIDSRFFLHRTRMLYSKNDFLIICWDNFWYLSIEIFSFKDIISNFEMNYVFIWQKINMIKWDSRNRVLIVITFRNIESLFVVEINSHPLEIALICLILVEIKEKYLFKICLLYIKWNSHDIVLFIKDYLIYAIVFKTSKAIQITNYIEQIV